MLLTFALPVFFLSAAIKASPPRTRDNDVVSALGKIDDFSELLNDEVVTGPRIGEVLQHLQTNGSGLDWTDDPKSNGSYVFHTFEEWAAAEHAVLGYAANTFAHAFSQLINGNRTSKRLSRSVPAGHHLYRRLDGGHDVENGVKADTPDGGHKNRAARFFCYNSGQWATDFAWNSISGYACAGAAWGAQQWGVKTWRSQRWPEPPPGNHIYATFLQAAGWFTNTGAAIACSTAMSHARDGTCKAFDQQVGHRRDVSDSGSFKTQGGILRIYDSEPGTSSKKLGKMFLEFKMSSEEFQSMTNFFWLNLPVSSAAVNSGSNSATQRTSGREEFGEPTARVNLPEGEHGHSNADTSVVTRPNDAIAQSSVIPQSLGRPQGIHPPNFPNSLYATPTIPSGPNPGHYFSRTSIPETSGDLSSGDPSFTSILPFNFIHWDPTSEMNEAALRTLRVARLFSRISTRNSPQAVMAVASGLSSDFKQFCVAIHNIFFVFTTTEKAHKQAIRRLLSEISNIKVEHIETCNFSNQDAPFYMQWQWNHQGTKTLMKRAVRDESDYILYPVPPAEVLSEEEPSEGEPSKSDPPETHTWFVFGRFPDRPCLVPMKGDSEVMWSSWAFGKAGSFGQDHKLKNGVFRQP
ncbi:MAG: hypothetical protein Q9227_006122 [Pyrenula ochraceoflavens]